MQLAQKTLRNRLLLFMSCLGSGLRSNTRGLVRALVNTLVTTVSECGRVGNVQTLSASFQPTTPATSARVQALIPWNEHREQLRSNSKLSVSLPEAGKIRL